MTLQDARRVFRRWGAVAAYCARKQREIDDLERLRVAAVAGMARPLAGARMRSNAPGDPTAAAVAMIEAYSESIRAAQEAVAVELAFKRWVDAMVDDMDEETRRILHLCYVRRHAVRRIASQTPCSKNTVYRILDRAAYKLLLSLEDSKNLRAFQKLGQSGTKRVV